MTIHTGGRTNASATTRAVQSGRIPRGTVPWNPTLPRSARKDGAPARTGRPRLCSGQVHGTRVTGRTPGDFIDSVGAVGVLRLRGCFASRSSHFAQDDNLDGAAKLRSVTTRTYSPYLS